MTTNPSHEHQPRDPAGRFSPVPLAAVDLDLAPAPGDYPTAQWPDDAADPDEAQAMLHEVAWDSTRGDDLRALAATDAIDQARIQRGGKLDCLPPGDEAEGHLTDALRDRELLLDAVHELGPIPYPASRAFGDELAGKVYDLHMARREELLVTRARFLADQVLPPESEASRRAADDGRIDPQAPFEWCRPCGGNGFHPWQDPETGSIEPETCRDCFSTGREELTPVDDRA